jgi:Lsr2
MAQKIQTLYVDDLDGSAAEGTIHFSFEGTDYEIDLNAAHAKALRKALDKYIEAGRKVSRAAGRGSRRGRAPGTGPNSSSEVRAWARRQGITVSDRGRIPGEVTARFKEETGA